MSWVNTPVCRVLHPLGSVTLSEMNIMLVGCSMYAAPGTNGCFTRTCHKHPLCQTTRLYIIRVLVYEVTGAPGETPALYVRKLSLLE